MKKLIMIALLVATAGLFAEDKVAIKFELPAPHSSGTPKEVKSDNLEPDPGPGKYRAPIMVPVGFDKKLTTEETKVTTSEEAVTGENEYVVDGDKTPDATCMLQLPGGLQWVQLDLGAEKTVSAVCVWHDQGDDRVYKDVIVQLSNDEKFAKEQRPRQHREARQGCRQGVPRAQRWPPDRRQVDEGALRALLLQRLIVRTRQQLHRDRSVREVVGS